MKPIILWLRYRAVEAATVTAPAAGAAVTHQWWLLAAAGVFAGRWVWAETRHRPDAYPTHDAQTAPARADLTA